MLKLNRVNVVVSLSLLILGTVLMSAPVKADCENKYKQAANYYAQQASDATKFGLILGISAAFYSGAGGVAVGGPGLVSAGVAGLVATSNTQKEEDAMRVAALISDGHSGDGFQIREILSALNSQSKHPSIDEIAKVIVDADNSEQLCPANSLLSLEEAKTFIMRQF